MSMFSLSEYPDERDLKQLKTYLQREMAHLCTGLRQRLPNDNVTLSLHIDLVFHHDRHEPLGAHGHVDAV